jgi:hypothetical protein
MCAMIVDDEITDMVDEEIVAQAWQQAMRIMT